MSERLVTPPQCLQQSLDNKDIHKHSHSLSLLLTVLISPRQKQPHLWLLITSSAVRLGLTEN